MRHAVPVRGVAAAHDRGAVACALLSAGHAHAQEPEGQAGRGAAVGVVEIGIARVDHQIVGVQQRRQRCS